MADVRYVMIPYSIATRIYTGLCRAKIVIFLKSIGLLSIRTLSMWKEPKIDATLEQSFAVDRQKKI